MTTELFSHVVKHMFIRVFLSLAVVQDLELEQTDVKTVFLEKIFMRQTEGFMEPDKEDHVCELKINHYKLKQSPR